MLDRDDVRARNHEFVSNSRDGGRTAAANYRELFQIGRGGFATISVALAQGIEGFSKLVVLKTLREELTFQPGATKMFLDEARLLARMNHPNIVQVYEVFRRRTPTVIVMEYVDAQPLTNILTRCRETEIPLRLEYGLLILSRVLAALQYAHTLCDFAGDPLGLIHRDVSPHNVMVAYDGQVKLLDFGIAKLAGSQLRNADETLTGMVKGKITYMAPEQFTGPFDHRADIFAVGVMLWELPHGDATGPAFQMPRSWRA
jgi:eukaryotic-like serine/threonine-protein kinase